MSTTCLPNCLCDCCVGTAKRTPVDTVNRQGLETLRYRVGTHGDFFSSMIAALANARIELASDFAGSAGLGGSLVGGGIVPGGNFSEYPLAALTARTPDDPAVAFMDAWSVVLDVLSFYQERVANEGYLRTATEFRSLFELARLVGYSPRPGVAANVFLAYGLEKDSKLVIKAGSRAQSVPESGQEPQSFESCEDFYARDGWNFLAPRKARPQFFEPGQTTAGKRVWFNGLNTLLKPSDPLIVVFDAAQGEPFRVKKIVPDNAAQITMAVLGDFAAMPLLADAGAALREVQKRITRALFAFREAIGELMETPPAIPPSPVGTIDLAAITSVLTELEKTLANNPPSANQQQSSSHALEVMAGLRSTLETLGKPLSSNVHERELLLRTCLDDLIASLEAVEEYLSFQTTAYAVSTNQPPGVTVVQGPFQEEYSRIRAKWTAQFVTNLSPVALTNLMYETREFLASRVDPAHQLEIDEFLATTAKNVTVMVRSIVRANLTRFRRPTQAGVRADTRIAVKVFKNMISLDTLLRQPKPNVDDIKSIAGKFKILIDDLQTDVSVTLVQFVAKVKNDLDAGDIDTNEAVRRLKEKLSAFAQQSTDLSARVTQYEELDPVNLINKTKMLELLRTHREATQDTPFKVEHEFVQFAFTHLKDEPVERGDYAKVATSLILLWKNVLSGSVGEYRDRIQSLVESAEFISLNAAANANPVVEADVRTALQDFVAKDFGLALSRDITPEQFGLFLDYQLRVALGVVTALEKAVAELDSTTGDAIMIVRRLRVALDRGHDGERTIREWIDALLLICNRFLDTSASDIATFSKQLDESVALLPNDIRVAATGYTTYLKSDLELDAIAEVKARQSLLKLVKERYWLDDDESPALLVRLARRISELLSKIPQLEPDEKFLVRLGEILNVLRQQRRIANSGVYPRVAPWLNEFAETLDQLIGDLRVATGPAVRRVGKVDNRAPIVTDAQFPDLSALKLSPSQPPVHSSKLVRELNGKNDTSSSDFSSRHVSDLVPQLVIAFDNELNGALYDAINNARTLREHRFQGIHVLRARSAPFGHNLPGRPVLKTDGTVLTEGTAPAFHAKPPEDWDLAQAEQDKKNVLRLDAVFDKVTPGSFVIIERSSPPNDFPMDNPLVARIEAVSIVSPTDYGSAGATVTQLTLDRPWLSDTDVKLSAIRDVTVYLQSEPLELAGEPFDADVGPVPGADDGQSIELDEVYDGLPSGRWLIVSGERTDVPNTTGVKGAELVMLSNASQVVDAVGSPGQGRPHTLLKLASPLSYSYQRGTVTIYSNVVKADQGETKSEILGAGAAAVKGQRFALKQQPLTYVAAATPSGAVDTAQVRVNGMRWHGANRFTQLGPNDHGYVLQTDAAGKTYVVFGDGVYGARLPTGIENVRATYRVGMGKSGNVSAGKITNLVSRPLGVKEVTNPMPAVGGVDRETTDQIRRNAPIGVTALDRLVSVQDYEDFARGFAGIEKAYAARLSDGYTQRLHLTIAGRDGGEIPESSDLYRNLLLALRKFGDPSLPLTVAPRRLLLIVASMRIRALPDFEFEPVVRAVRERLLQSFGFDRSEFGQDVVLSDVIGTIHRVRGVAALVVDQFGLLFERQPDGTPTPLSEIIKQLKEIPAISPTHHVEEQSSPESVDKPFRSRLSVAKTTYRDGKIIPAEIAILSPNVADTLILNEWKT